MSAASFDLTLPTDIRVGAGRAAEAPDVVAGWGARRVLVVTGRSTERAAPLAGGPGRAGHRDVDVRRGRRAHPPGRPRRRRGRRAGCDAVIGFGGGSALDVAKAVAVLAVSGADPLEHLEVIGEGRPITRPGLPCVAVPTTAGTGSEVTRNSVLSGDGVKASLRSPLMLPRVAIVDPDLLVGLPAATVAAGGMDALAQVIEPFLSRRANPFTDALARDGIVRSARSLRRAVTDGMVRPRCPVRPRDHQPVRRVVPGQLRSRRRARVRGRARGAAGSSARCRVCGGAGPGRGGESARRPGTWRLRRPAADDRAGGAADRLGRRRARGRRPLAR